VTDCPLCLRSVRDGRPRPCRRTALSDRRVEVGELIIKRSAPLRVLSDSLTHNQDIRSQHGKFAPAPTPPARVQSTFAIMKPDNLTVLSEFLHKRENIDPLE